MRTYLSLNLNDLYNDYLLASDKRMGTHKTLHGTHYDWQVSLMLPDPDQPPCISISRVKNDPDENFIYPLEVHFSSPPHIDQSRWGLDITDELVKIINNQGPLLLAMSFDEEEIEEF